MFYFRLYFYNFTVLWEALCRISAPREDTLSYIALPTSNISNYMGVKKTSKSKNQVNFEQISLIFGV